ncbi:MAG: HEPN domain-containing protein [Candidatus Methanoperedens sp.]|nr:MAG: HEPN domain-containing protein [Candidatus Methanoperedens sp.]
MRTDELALDYIDRAGLTLEEAKSAFEKEVYSLTIRRAQETCELSLKGALRYLAIEYPRDHDVSDVLIRVKETRQIPEWFYEKIEFMAGVSSDLARKRGPAFYGIERSVTPASKIFGRDEALRALKGAEEILKLCRSLIKEEQKE